MTITGTLSPKKIGIGRSSNKVHYGWFDESGRYFGSFCGAENCSTGFRRRSGVRLTNQEYPVTCERCKEKENELKKNGKM